ncbi:MAG: tRNA pseudouridine(38-40) synthase TruA [Candidatus Omnitrophota bacterium]|jgi:tRNA pseudouridine38-40 synthase
MRNIRLEIEYDGSAYSGWQVQPKGRGRTIQAVIEKTLRKILQEKIKLIASGRTDAGVHARAQVANFFTRSGMLLNRLKIAMNGLLPEDIKVTGLNEKGKNFHSRFGAKSKVYRYTILNRGYSSPLLRNTVYFYPHPLDVELMRKEALSLLGKHDFSAFCASRGREKNPVKTVKKLSVIKKKDFVYINIEADGFLYNMARNIVGTLIEIGRGSLGAGSLKKILLSRKRALAGPNIPAKGLCLLEVKY